MMEEKVYKALNDITINFEEYQEKEVDEVTKERWIRNAKKSIRKRVLKGILKPVAAVGIVAIGMAYALPVYAMTDPFLYKIADFIRVTKALGTYSEAINEVVTNNGITVQLGQVMVDNDEVMVTLRVKSETPLPKYCDVREADVYINGRIMELTNFSSERQIDEYTWEFCMNWLGTSVFEGDLDIKVIFKEFGSHDEQIKGRWSFEFTTKGDELMVDTFEVPIQERIFVPGGEEIFVEKYIGNQVSQKIYFKTLKPIEGAQTEFRLYDEAGKEFDQELVSRSVIGDGVYKWKGIGDELLENTLTLNLEIAKYGE